MMITYLIKIFNGFKKLRYSAKAYKLFQENH